MAWTGWTGSTGWLLRFLRGVLPLGRRRDDPLEAQVDRHRAVHLVAVRHGAEQEQAFGDRVGTRLGEHRHVFVLERGENGIAVGGRLLEERDELGLAARALFLVVLVRRRGVPLERRAGAELAERH